jgi:mono/diheme cytochrome c family protein
MRANKSRVLRWRAFIAAGLLFVTAGLLYSGVTPLDDWKAPDRAARKKNPVPADAAAIAAGKGIYAANCLACHGTGGKGDGPAAAAINPPPKDLSDPKIAAQTDGELFWKITEGKKPMPAFETLLSDTDRWKVVDYIRTFMPPSATQPSH